MKRLHLVLFLFLGITTSLIAQLPEDFSDTSIDGPWDSVLGITFDQNGQGYAWGMFGQVYILDTTGTVLAEPLIDISEEVAKWIDAGCLGFTLDPNFQENGYFYLLYTVDRHHLLHFGTTEYDPEATITHQATIGRITRYTADREQSFQKTIPGSRKVILGSQKDNGFPILFHSHTVGSLVFGTDGTLLASCGDGASSVSIDNGSDPNTFFEQALEDGIIQPKDNVGAFKSQMISNLNGKIVRIDPETGEGVPSNPFYDPAAPNAAQSKVWALGLRNPYKFIKIPETGSHNPEHGQPGTFIIGDVGEGYREEINILKGGGQNFGWPMYEGLEAHPVFPDLMTQNQDAPNPLACDQTYFNFQDLLAPDYLDGNTLTNPCDPAQPIPNGIPTYTHTRPAIAYQNQDDTSIPFAETPTYDDQGYPLITPIEDTSSPVESAHFQGDASMTGAFYTGSHFPEEYRNKYYHIDYRGWIRMMNISPDGDILSTTPFHSNCPKITSLAENPVTGHLYYVSVGDIKIHRIEYGGNPAPVIIAQATPKHGPSPLEVQFQANQSYDLNSSILYHWDFRDGTESTNPNPIHTFIAENGQPKTIEVTLTLSDTLGASSTLQIPVYINNAPPDISILSPSDQSQYPMDETSLINLRADINDRETNNEDLSVSWEVFLHHNDHFHPSSVVEGKNGYTLISPLGCVEEEYWYRIVLQVEDEQGMTSTKEINIYPYCDPPFGNTIELTGTSSLRDVTLKWEAPFGVAISNYEIQRTNDLLNYQTLGTVGSGSISRHTFVDKTPATGINFYRVKAITEDNAFDYSKLQAVNFPADENVNCFPNPVEKELNVALKVAESPTISFFIYDTRGRLVLSDSWATIPGEPSTHRLNTKNLSPGVYFYIADDNKHRYGGKFLKR